MSSMENKGTFFQKKLKRDVNQVTALLPWCCLTLSKIYAERRQETISNMQFFANRHQDFNSQTLFVTRFSNLTKLAKADKLSWILPFHEKQLVIMCDASEHASVYALLTEDCTDTAEGPPEAYALIVFWSRRFTAGQMSLTM